MEKIEEVTKLVPRASWKGCDACWKAGVAHNGKEAAFGGPCYIRFAYCEHCQLFGMRLWPRKSSRWKGVRKDGRGRWVWTTVAIEPKLMKGEDMEKMHALDALIKIHNEMPALKQDLKNLRNDIEGLIRQKDHAEEYLFRVVEAVNQGSSPEKIKKIAVRGMAKVK